MHGDPVSLRLPLQLLFQLSGQAERCLFHGPCHAPSFLLKESRPVESQHCRNSFGGLDRRVDSVVLDFEVGRLGNAGTLGNR